MASKQIQQQNIQKSYRLQRFLIALKSTFNINNTSPT